VYVSITCILAVSRHLQGSSIPKRIRLSRQRGFPRMSLVSLHAKTRSRRRQSAISTPASLVANDLLTGLGLVSASTDRPSRPAVMHTVPRILSSGPVLSIHMYFMLQEGDRKSMPCETGRMGLVQRVYARSGRYFPFLWVAVSSCMQHLRAKRQHMRSTDSMWSSIFIAA